MKSVEIGGKRVQVWGYWEFQRRFKRRLKWHIDWMKHLIAAYALATGSIPMSANEVLEVLELFKNIAPYYLPTLIDDQWRIRRLVQEIRAEVKKYGVNGFVERWYTTLLVAPRSNQEARR